ncbi:MAG: hypothetical protein A2X56_05670 [Nitrospirae bacterium GWC2_57_13]|jgi:hypothetical protein|nr:MAG: hypothetical protein A2X56_05670 [Nitrospirae bacterium GWC2_57_13]OGW43890.1 MAG: hypothetical protein A2X57_00540 [Nitrospirae bacterium GWD2_57_8]HAS55544.1 hypothetical protein [Nitrospiraceae bacterium]
MKILVAYDGTLQAKKALAYGIGKAKEKNAALIVQHVFNAWAFKDYDASLTAETAARSECARFLSEAEAMIKDKGLKASIVTMDGDPEKEVVAFAKEEGVDILLCPPKYRSVIARYQKALEKEGRAVNTTELADAAQLTLAAVVAGRKN